MMLRPTAQGAHKSRILAPKGAPAVPSPQHSASGTSLWALHPQVPPQGSAWPGSKPHSSPAFPPHPQSCFASVEKTDKTNEAASVQAKGHELLLAAGWLLGKSHRSSSSLCQLRAPARAPGFSQLKSLPRLNSSRGFLQPSARSWGS